MTVPSACMDLELCETTRYLRPVRTDEAKIESANYINMQRDGSTNVPRDFLSFFGAEF